VTFQSGHRTIEILDADLTTLAVDAIVNAANDHLWMGSGVAGAIKARGGDQIERDAMAQGPIEAGGAVVTGAGHLPARYVIHAAAMGQDLTTSPDLILRATRSALALAAELALESVAFPALGTGVGGFPVERCAEIMCGVVRDLSDDRPSRIVFALRGEGARVAFERGAGRIFMHGDV
jgi:O-acetyl-ADP-ribose deacetylase (regulator of RNase III)